MFTGYHRAIMHDDILSNFRPVQTVLFELEVEKKIYNIMQTGSHYTILTIKRNYILLMQLPANKLHFFTSVT